MHPPAPTDLSELGPRLRSRRLELGLSMRQLAERAAVATSYVSSVEAGRTSPTIATLHKLLVALDTDLSSFFTVTAPAGHVFGAAQMPCVEDASRRYTLVLPPRPDIRCELMDEIHHPAAAPEPEFEALGGDLAGYLLSGALRLEVQGRETVTLQAGDAFYVPAGRPVRGTAAGQQSARLITVMIPPRY